MATVDPPEPPPGPWRWERVTPGALERRRHPVAGRDDDHAARTDAGPRGWGLIGADGRPVLLHDAGWGTVDLGDGLGFRPDHPIAALLARAWEIPQLEAALAHARAGVDDVEELRALARRQAADLAEAHARHEQLTAALREARSWASLLADTFGVPRAPGSGHHRTGCSPRRDSRDRAAPAPGRPPPHGAGPTGRHDHGRPRGPAP
ncbi:hypothetical protein [Geodermatophilus sp. URMC 63]